MVCRHRLKHIVTESTYSTKFNDRTKITILNCNSTLGDGSAYFKSFIFPPPASRPRTKTLVAFAFSERMRRR